MRDGKLHRSASIREGISNPSPLEVTNLSNRSKNYFYRMSLNLKKTWEMVVREKSKKPVPDEISNIGRKKELKHLGVV